MVVDVEGGEKRERVSREGEGREGGESGVY